MKQFGDGDIPIEERNGDEVSIVEGRTNKGGLEEVHLVNPDSPTSNYAFDVTPARLVTGLITERGICDATEQAIATLFPSTGRK